MPSSSESNLRKIGTLAALDRAVSACRACPRLVEWRERAASERRAAYRGETYWGRAVPSFGAGDARILVVGLAPAAHGANRTGRMFTGDRSGDFLYRALYEAGLSSQPEAWSVDDGLVLNGVRVTSVVRCAPPENRPSTAERDRCLPFLRQELALLEDLRVIVCLGAFAWDNCARELAVRPRPKFAHGLEHEADGLTLLGSYHPSQRNTFTGLLTSAMFAEVFGRASQLAGLRG